uniref:hypothetical protein n=1 Tax=Diaporthe sojae TaxID=165439 RepID=UPI002410B3CB|nr:hypothetical protein QAZ32_mgp34 [Diaporthe sojae]WET30405.1 hypothetical protein [Diaporthe sojae]
MAPQFQSRLFSTYLSSSSSHSSSHFSFTSSLSSRDIKQEKGIGEEDWIIAEDGGPTSFQPPRPETPLADGLPRSFQSPVGKPSGQLHEPLSKGENNVSYLRITGWTNSCSPLVSISINRDTHEYSNACSCFWCEDKRDTIPDTLNTPTLPANPIVPHEFSVNCPCLSCEDRREETLGSPSTRQQPAQSSPFLDLVPRDSIPVIISPELLSPPLPPTSFSHDNSQDREGFFYDDVRIENYARLASLEPALPIQPQSAVRVAPAISAIRRNPSRQAKEKALVRIRECLGKKSKFYLVNPFKDGKPSPVFDPFCCLVY